jgi:hypothetical protein
MPLAKPAAGSKGPLSLANDNLAREILGLSKMNRSSADDHGSFPITLAFARKVGAIRTVILQDRSPLAGYRFYVARAAVKSGPCS